MYVIDEIDRSLHSLLTWQLINAYLECCHADSRSQLLLATHDLLLMDQSLFRRDEIWLTERNREGRSELFSLNDFEGIRNEKDVLESYLRGKFGGIPKLQLHHALVDRSKDS